jgi:CRP-like cAMP-binding protein
LTRARAALLREFSDGEQPSARALAALLKPDCVFDENLTQQARARQVAGLAVTEHYDAGQVIVHRGETIDAKILAALGQLRDKTLPDQLNQQIATARAQTQQAHDQAQQEHTLAQQAQAQAQKSQTEAEHDHEQALQMHERAIDSQSQALQTRTHNEELIGAMAGVSVITLLVLWRLARQRKQVSLLPATVLTPENRAGNNQVVLQNDLIPHLAQALKETLVQELAAQRGELLKAQQSATAEIAGLVRRLDELQSPMRERLRTYETQIQKLEKDLAEQNDENRELLKLKIEMIRRQLEAERVGFN